MVQDTDFRQAQITGTTGGITGGVIVGPEQSMIIKSIHYSDLGATGNNVLVEAIPSGGNVDVKHVAANESPDTRPGGDGIVGKVEQDNVLRVTTNNAEVSVRVAYYITEGH